MVPPRDGPPPSDDDRSDPSGFDSGNPDPLSDRDGEERTGPPAGDDRDARQPNGGSSHAAPERESGRVSEYTSPLSDDHSEPLGSPRQEDDDDVGWQEFVYDVVSSVVAVLLVGVLLFAVSGVWPPMVAIESPSMHPHMQEGDLVFVMDEERFPAEAAHADTGVVTAKAGSETQYTKFQNPGDVIVFEPNGDERQTPIIHRAVFWVEEGENWYDEADKSNVGGADDCEELRYCPAPHAGFITKGDANARYDQVGSTAFSSPVKPEWVIGTAELRVPKLGWIRLRSSEGISGAAQPGPVSTGAPAAPNATAPTANATVSAANATAMTPNGSEASG